jgi:hypothetical protein
MLAVLSNDEPNDCIRSEVSMCLSGNHVWNVSRQGRPHVKAWIRTRGSPSCAGVLVALTPNDYPIGSRNPSRTPSQSVTSTT